MKVSLLTVGTRGDVQPMVALALALAGRGCEVTLAGATDSRDLVERAGVRFVPIHAEFLTMARSAAGMRAIRGDPLAGWRLYRELAVNTRRMLDEATAAAAGADALVFHPKALAGRHLVEAWGIPGWVFAPVPVLVPTTAFPAPGTLRRGPRPVNRMTYRLPAMAESMFAGQLGSWRLETLGLDPTPAPGVRSAGARRLPVLHAHSRFLLSTPPDWDADCHVTGFWTLPVEQEPELAPEVASFLDAGTPPVMVGFGSMGVPDEHHAARMVAGAIRATGHRGILVGLPSVPGDDMLSVSSAPHGRLLPRCAVTVHHGGSGTVAATLLAGIPTVVVPQGLDQPFWARRVAEAGVGVHLPRRRISANRLAEAIRQAAGAQVVGRVAVMAASMRAEGGAGRAAELVMDGRAAT